MKRRFEFVEGTSSKFYEVEVSRQRGQRRRTAASAPAGQTQTKQFASQAEAQKHADKQIAQKLKKGYVEQGRGLAQLPTHRNRRDSNGTIPC